jgi:hypothetical protein
LIRIWTCEALVDDELGDYYFWAKRPWIENVNTTNIFFWFLQIYKEGKKWHYVNSNVRSSLQKNWFWFIFSLVMNNVYQLLKNMIENP